MSELKHRTDDLIQGRYQVRKIMGSGAFGTVYGCRDNEIDVPVAVKELHVLDPKKRSAKSRCDSFAPRRRISRGCAIPTSFRATTNPIMATGISVPWTASIGPRAPNVPITARL